MNFKARNSNITKVLYIVLVLCIVSIMFLSIYSLFNPNNKNADQNNGNNNPNMNLQNSSDDSLGIFKNRETQPPPATKPAKPPKPVTDSNTAPNDNKSPDKTPGSTPANQQPTEKPADLFQAADDAVAVLSVPSPFIKPVQGAVSKNHSPDQLEYCVAMNDYRTHTGIDIDSEVGVNVKAVSDGIISDIYDDTLMGKTVVIDHYGGIQSIYMNLQPSLPKNIVVGASVKGGDIIGGVGETSLIEVSDVAHLHFEMKKDGDFVNPLDYIDF